ncbi:CDP-alcohol phosphatidyltransferase family protein [Falsirhodobacter algicola]|uniref:CDP-alcohol phosphatidyltransferase family protein n=1 Tax=Falsirhodobacter algicola TaxID=2692330 RepID=A0A8J8MVE1_9RHOB|nr:CDP-alcohol phosphatidyltransferase family protein [Falsirhodobacter algicola]QUS37028.1 CDP-alcohol phosphatidyltransferase family protein [Falsirhodobacter algicola]
MIDAYIHPVQRTVLQTPAQWLARRGVRADSVSLAGFALGLLAVPALALGWWGAAFALIVANRVMDGLDGAVAQIHGPTERGAFLDIALDFVFYALVPVGFALHDPAAHALPAAVLIAAFVGTGSSFLAFAAIAARSGRQAEQFPQKGIYYLGGLTEGFETIALFLLMCLLPAAFAPLAWTFAAACAVTTVLRWHQGWTAFAPPSVRRPR